MSGKTQKVQKGFFLKGEGLLELDHLMKSQPLLTEITFRTLSFYYSETGLLLWQLLMVCHVSLETNKHSLAGDKGGSLSVIRSNPAICKDSEFWRRKKKKKKDVYYIIMDRGTGRHTLPNFSVFSSRDWRFSKRMLLHFKPTNKQNILKTFTLKAEENNRNLS